MFDSAYVLTLGGNCECFADIGKKPWANKSATMTRNCWLGNGISCEKSKRCHFALELKKVYVRLLTFA